jgi:hypothetical protein
MGTLRLSDETNEAIRGDVERADEGLLDEVNDVEAFVDRLEARADELSPQASNANRILSAALIVFLASDSGCEFGASLRFCTYQRFQIANERTEELRKELQGLEEQLSARRSVFAFVETLTSRMQHRIRIDS